MDRTHAHSLTEKTIFILGHLSILLFCVWLACFGGFETVGRAVGGAWRLSDPFRAYLMLGCAALYWVRHALTLFYLMARRVGWPEVFGLLVFFSVFEVGLLLIGGGAFRQHPVALNWLDLFALTFVGTGSFLNTFSELQRKWWKDDPANKGRCYTEGLFKYSMHINFFGDTVLFTGWSLLTASGFALVLPLFMAAMFVFHHIPSLDAYLEQRYGDEFRSYAKRTKRFIPFVL